MDTFFKLNKEKIRFGFLATSLTLVSFVFLILTIAYFAKSLPNANLLIAIFLIAGVGLPTFVLGLSYIKWLYRQTARQKALSVEPFDQLDDIGFVNSLSNLNTKWHFTEKIKTLLLDGYTLNVDISEERSNTLELEIPVQLKKLDKTRFDEVTDKFDRYDIELGIGCLKKSYKISDKSFRQIDELKVDLENVLTVIKEEGFEPN